MLDDLRTVLDRYPAIARPSAPPEPLGNAGGLSGSRLWRYRSGRGCLIARAWPEDGPPRLAIEQIHRWLVETSDLGFVPVPLAALDGRTLQEHGGRLWEVAPCLDGKAAPIPPSTIALGAGFAALAAFHQRLRTGRTLGPSPGLQRRLHEVETLLGGGFSTLGRAGSARPNDPCWGPAQRWLELARRTAPRLLEPLRRSSARVVALQPCLRDVRPDHLLFQGDRLTGLVDFGAMAVESVAADLARLLTEWIGPDRVRRAEALKAYAAIRPLGEAETALIDAFDASAALLGAGHWVRWHFVEGRSFDEPGAVERGIARGLERVGRLAAELR
jgi:Ser/Thr protein kinase RdoA (MazF antagonist)